MSYGITYEGEIGRVGLSSEPQEQVELICTHPRFLELATAKKPNFLVRLFDGAISFPRDWWYCANFLSMRLGLFGTEGRASTDHTARRSLDLLFVARDNPPFAIHVIRIVMGHLVHYPELYGRQGAMLATGAGVVALGATTPIALGIAVTNFVMATTGAVVRAVDEGADSLAEIVVAAAIGESDPVIAEMISRELAFAPEDGDYDLPTEQEKHILHVLEGVLHCLRNPGEYLNRTGQASSQQVVPVGRVSSMRPRGVMGSISAGHETNALDVIGDEAWFLKTR